MKRQIMIWAVVAVLAAMVAIGFWQAGQGSSAATVASNVRYDKESKYYRIIVEDYPQVGRRCLLFSRTRGIQSSMIIASPNDLDFRYTKSMMAAMALHPNPKNILLVGLGGASIPKYIQAHWPEAKLDIVEIDPDVVKVCQQWFEFKPAANTRIITMDGRLFIKNSKDSYDVILLDAYAGDRVPFHMTTKEFVALVKARLTPDGVVATNIWEQSINRFFNAECKTYQESFSQTYAYRSAQTGNVIIFGTQEAKPISKADWIKQALAVTKDQKLGFSLGDVVSSEYLCITETRIDEKALTDDMAPVETLRRENPKYFEGEQPK
jgi:spermidine synthase